MGRDAGIVSLQGKVDESECGEVPLQRPYRVPGDEPSRTRAHPSRPEVMQAQRRVPFASGVRVAIVEA